MYLKKNNSSTNVLWVWACVREWACGRACACVHARMHGRVGQSEILCGWKLPTPTTPVSKCGAWCHMFSGIFYWKQLAYFTWQPAAWQLTQPFPRLYASRDGVESILDNTKNNAMRKGWKVWTKFSERESLQNHFLLLLDWWFSIFYLVVQGIRTIWAHAPLPFLRN